MKAAMNKRQDTLEILLESLDLCECDGTFCISRRFGNNCEWCGRIRIYKKCECKLNVEAKMIARRFV